MAVTRNLDDDDLQTVTAVPAMPPVSDGNQEFPVPLRAFAQTLVHTEDEVWIHHLRVQHGRENHTPTQWRALLETHRNAPAHWAE